MLDGRSNWGRLTLCNSRDYSLPGSSVHGIFQAEILEWVATSYTRGSNPHLLGLLHWQADSLPLVGSSKATIPQLKRTTTNKQTKTNTLILLLLDSGEILRIPRKSMRCSMAGILSRPVEMVIYQLVLGTVGFPGGTSGKEAACQFRRRKRPGLDP